MYTRHKLCIKRKMSAFSILNDNPRTILLISALCTPVSVWLTSTSGSEGVVVECLVVNLIIFTYVELNYDQRSRLVFKGNWLSFETLQWPRCSKGVTQVEEILMYCLCGILVSPTGFFNYINMYCTDSAALRLQSKTSYQATLCICFCWCGKVCTMKVA